MWRRGRKSLLPLLLASLVCAPVWASDGNYQVTEAQLTELETVFAQLRGKQAEQASLLTEQANQLTSLRRALNESRAQIGTLNYQLQKSRESITSSQTEVQAFQSSLTEARESFEKSEKAHQQTEKRVKRQRTIWAVLAIAAGAWAAAK